MLEIKNHTMLLDGRSMLETVGWRRFRLLEKNSVDGYTTGRVEYFDDISSGEVAAEEENVAANNREAVASRDRAEQERLSASASPPSAPEVNAGASAQASSEESATATTAPVSDAPSAAASPLPPAEQAPTMTDLIRTATSFIELLRTQTQPGLFEQIVATYGPVPQPLEIDKLSWWLGMVLPIDEHAKSSLLPVRSPRKRLEMIARWIERIEGSWRTGR
jgi:Lon protease-like protein